MLVGNCPHCDKFVVEVYKKNYKGKWSSFQAKKRKALRLFEQYASNIVNRDSSIKYGNRSNMAFRYGLNIEANQKGKKIIKRYAVDFNGTKELLNN